MAAWRTEGYGAVVAEIGHRLEKNREKALWLRPEGGPDT